MTHPDMEARIDLLLDGELAAADAAELGAHLGGCASCERFRDDRLALRSAIATEMPRLETPERLRARVRAALREPLHTPTRHPMRERMREPLGQPLPQSVAPGRPVRRAPIAAWRRLALAATLVAVAGASAVGGWRLGSARTASTVLADEVLASHVRSLMPGHLSDVVSTDQHTVKPWFDGRLDFSPPVHDLSGRGYPLLGGRLDYVGGRPVAALVYGRRRHVINVFVWPADAPERLAASQTRRGYHLLHWATPDLAYWVASDVRLSEVTELADLLRLADSTAGSAGK